MYLVFASENITGSRKGNRGEAVAAVSIGKAIGQKTTDRARKWEMYRQGKGQEKDMKQEGQGNKRGTQKKLLN